jgi:hypothetical protein
MKVAAVVALAALVVAASAGTYRRTERYHGHKVFQWYVSAKHVSVLVGNFFPLLGSGGGSQHLPRCQVGGDHV